MSKYWLNYISCTRLEPLSENKEQKKKQEYGENIRKGAKNMSTLVHKSLAQLRTAKIEG
jgi:hypothetical protein